MLSMLMVVTKDRNGDRALDAECVECAMSRVKMGYAPALRSLGFPPFRGHAHYAASVAARDLSS